MGDWHLDRDGKWQYDEDAPRPDPTPTSMLPAVPAVHALHGDEDEPRPELAVPGFVKDDGSAYARMDPGWFDNYDEVDSRTIVDNGGPPDAA